MQEEHLQVEKIDKLQKVLESILCRLAVCDTDQKEITIDETYCWSVDHLGRPIDIYSEADYRMQCVGYWKENLKSYLITYDKLDAFTKYRCWVYQR